MLLVKRVESSYYSLHIENVHLHPLLQSREITKFPIQENETKVFMCKYKREIDKLPCKFWDGFEE